MTRHGIGSPGVSSAPPASAARLPDGFAVQLDPRVRRRSGDRVLVGGNPTRLLTLSATAADLLADHSTLRVCDNTTAALARRLLDTGVAHPRPGGRTSRADVTVVVPVRDRPDGLDRLLTAVGRTAGTLPVVVVDDGSLDPLAVRRVCARHFATVIRHGVALGPAAARNAGLAAARTPYVALLDSDSAPMAGWLDRLQAHFDDPLVAAAAPRIVALGVEDPGWLRAYEAAASSLDLGPHEGPVHPHSRVPYVPGVALLVRRTALTGGYDEAMHVAEDVDLVWRLVAAGWRVRYEPAAHVAHQHPNSVLAWAKRRAFYGTGAADLAARHGRAVAPIVISPWSAATWLALLAGRRSGPVCAAAILVWATARLARRLGAATDATDAALSWSLAARLVGPGTAFAGRQVASAVVRHFWPVSLLAAAISPSLRWWLAVLAAADGVLAWWPHRRRVPIAGFLLFRRLDDLCYGAGLWWGVARSGSLQALRPMIGPVSRRYGPDWPGRIVKTADGAGRWRSRRSRRPTG